MRASLDAWNGEGFETIESTPTLEMAAFDGEMLARLGYYTQVRVFGTEVITARYGIGENAQWWKGSDDDWTALELLNH